MYAIAKSLSYKNIEREQLVGCFNAENILFSTSMIQWFMEQEFRVFDVKKVVKFSRRKPFETFT